MAGDCVKIKHLFSIIIIFFKKRKLSFQLIIFILDKIVYNKNNKTVVQKKNYNNYQKR